MERREDTRLVIDAMTAADWGDVARIYQEGIETGVATFETNVPTWEHWDGAHLPACRLVGRFDDVIAGWAALSPVSARHVYRGVAEVSVYVGNHARRKGVGTALLQALIIASEANGIWTLQATITRENEKSVILHEKCGFRVVGYRERVGYMRGKWWDTILMERRSEVVGNG